ncbi:uncharacterized protein conserved in bacteria with the myosin-like domain protein [Rubidibacter lacunae KORDI 51-2]|uniref:Uncharacterized protein conserved in bacteria with the myosin-like domain protein n=1 Tax=Rubidibacter lacunae KORDI 51-2 TaxID=582515 RepID=U5DQG8_9CHRO|nr:DUF3084 domain-containing protein [Rubidibacter lacunae]ERN42864.1 uncharacterized protein conserved in bacteria with the myosin-like domain protein [Rubidibacter lacunae KORDI 51-2]
MTSAYILIVAILLLGGVLAALGDRIGSKVGKARLRLFKLRPRQTAVVVTVMTGTAIAASTLGIMLALSESLRDGLFRLDEIQTKRREIEKELASVSEEKERVDEELAAVSFAQERALVNLERTNADFTAAQSQLATVTEEVAGLRGEREELVAERDRLQEQIAERDTELTRQEQEIAAQEERLDASAVRLKDLEAQRSTLQSEIQARDRRIANLDTAIAQRDEVLSDLTQKTADLREEVAKLEQYFQYYQALRQGDVALVRGQTLAINVVRLNDPAFGKTVVDVVLREANRFAIAQTQPGVSTIERQIIEVSREQVEQLVEAIGDGNEYVIQVLSAGNYLLGEENIRVILNVATNREVFGAGDVIASVSVESTDDFTARLELLLVAAQFQAQRAGLLGKIRVGADDLGTVRFIERIVDTDAAVEQIRAIASDTTYAAGPLELQLVALYNGETAIDSDPENEDSSDRNADGIDGSNPERDE